MKLKSACIIVSAFLLGMIVPLAMDAQLFPEVDQLQGDILRIKEKHYGREVYPLFKRVSPAGMRYMPRAFSGWKFLYCFDEQNKLIKEIRTNRGRLFLESAFSEETLGGNILRRETYLRCQDMDAVGNYYEYEYILRSDSLVERVNYYASKRNDRKLFIVESNTKYNKGLLSYYTREGITTSGILVHIQTYKIYYDSLDRVSLIEELDHGYKFKEMEAPLSGNTSELVVDSILKPRKVWKYTYNVKDQLENYHFEYVNHPDHRSRDFDKYEMLYEYDKRGNWIKRYRKYDEGEMRLEATRKITYRN